MIIYSKQEGYKIWVDSKVKEFCFQLAGEDVNEARFGTAAEAMGEVEKLHLTKD